MVFANCDQPLFLFLIKKKLCVDVAHTRLLFHTCDRAAYQAPLGHAAHLRVRTLGPDGKNPPEIEF